MPAAALTRDEVVQRILAVFRQYGYEGASLARLSDATGLGRSSLYHYFPNGKEDMATAAIAAVDTWFGESLLPTLEGADPPKKRLKRFASKLAEFYQNGATACLSNVFTVGETGTVFQQRLGERMRALIRVLAAIAEEAGVGRAEAARRAEDAMIKIQGALIVSRALGTTAPFLRVIENFPTQLVDG